MGRSRTTIARWLERGATAAARFKHRMLRDFDIVELPADELCTFLGSKRRTLWPVATLEVRSRLWPVVCSADAPIETVRPPSTMSSSAGASLGAPARHHERHRESAQSYAPCAAACETLARRNDGAALGGRRGARSGKGGPSGERMSRSARAWGGPPGTRRAVRTRRVGRDGRVVLNRAATEFQQRTGHPRRR